MPTGPLAGVYLPRAYADGTDVDTRAQMMSGAAMGATAFQKGLGIIHALSHPIGALYQMHHGTRNAAVMPAVLQFDKPAVADKLADAARYLGIESGFDGFCDDINALNASLGIPRRWPRLA